MRFERASSARRQEAGAAAVEFALIAIALFPMLFGVVDYGVFFADAIALQHGVGDAARAATLASSDPENPFGTRQDCDLPDDLTAVVTDPQVRALVCDLEERVRTFTGDVRVKAQLVGPDGAPAAPGSLAFAQPNALRLCVLSRHEPILPVVPLPRGGVLSAEVEMPIEHTSGPAMLPLQTPTGLVDVTWDDVC